MNSITIDHINNNVSPRFTQFWRWGIIGIITFSVGFWILINDIEEWNVIWYLPAWYGYLLVLDTIIYTLQRNSFLSHRRKELVTMMCWSVPFWFLFEAYNLIIKNWYYVFVLHNNWIQIIFTWLAFATVIPACFIHAELLKAFKCWQNTSCRKVNVDNWLINVLIISGVMCILLPLIWPTYFFWMVWGALIGVPDVINYKIGAPSILQDLKTGKPGRLYRLLAGGLIAGFVWETLNFWARCKWIYTVPGLEEWKLFEMPFFGFLGFPILAVEAFAYYSLLSHFLRGGRSWEKPDDQPARPFKYKLFAVVGIIAILFSLTTNLALLDITVKSRRPLLTDLKGIDNLIASKLKASEISTPELLYQAVIDDGIYSVVQKTNVEEDLLYRAFNESSLVLHKGMGIENARLLRLAGIKKVTDLVSMISMDLYHRLKKIAKQNNLPAPQLAEIKVWVRAARLWQTSSR